MPVLPFWAADILITLVGQPAAYWQNFSQHNEGNPIFARLLTLHPGAFLAGALLWLGLIGLGAQLLPGRFARLWAVWLKADTRCSAHKDAYERPAPTLAA